VECYHNDYWPAEYTNKVIDLSSYAFKQLAPLSRWVVDVQIYILD
jgi:rare lipoprotein A (peptidoglycan hydrolase)